MRRREAITLLGAGALSATLAGCTDALDDVDPTDSGPAEGWTSHRGDPANSGVREADAGPGESLAMDWEVTHEDLLLEREGIAAEDLEHPLSADGASWPVLVEDRVVWTQGYTWPGEDGGRALVIAATDVADGSIAWSVALSEDLDFAAGWYAPMVHDDTVLLPNLVEGDLGLTVHDPADGSVLDRHEWGLTMSAAQPVVADGRVLVGVHEDQERRLYAFDADDGTPQWDVPADVPQPQFPHLAVGNDAVHYFDREDRAMVARELGSGAERWRAPVDLPMSFVTQRPGVLGPATISDHGIFAGGSIQQLVQRDVGTLAAFDPEAGDARFTHRPPGTDEGDPLRAINPDLDEAELEAIREEHFDGEGFTSVNCQPLVVDGEVIATGWGEVDGVAGTIVYGLDPDAETATWGVEIASESYAPVAAGDVIYLPTTDGVEAVSTDGEHLDSLVLESDAHNVGEHLLSVEFSPALGHGKLFVPTLHGIVALG